jgi:adenosine deaminase CECR1
MPTCNFLNAIVKTLIWCHRVSLSHEFYQVMVGSPSMNLHGWKQLIEWSITHSMLSDSEKGFAMNIFYREWTEFCQWVVDQYGEYADGLGFAI